MILILLSGFLLGCFLWDKISLPFKNPFGVTSLLTLERFNPATNLLRYLIFVILPSVILLTLYFIPAFRKWFFAGAPKEDEESSFFQNKQIKSLFYLISYSVMIAFFLPSLLSFFSNDFSLRHLDIYHEGEQLTPAYNYLKTGLLWKGTYFVHGLIEDPLIAFLGWKVFGHETIGAFRITLEFTYRLMPLLFSVFIIILSFAVTRPKEWYHRIILPQLLLALFIYTNLLFNMNFLYTEISGKLTRRLLIPRDIFFLMGFTFLVSALRTRNNFLFFLTGLFSASTFAYAIDRGAYFSILLFAIMVFLFFFPPADDPKRNKNNMFSLLGGIFCGWVAFVAIFTPGETAVFIKDAIFTCRTHDLSWAYIYPGPFNSRMWPMVIIGLECYALLVYFVKDYRFNTGTRYVFYIHTCLVLTAMLYFCYAVSRPDIWHLLTGSSFAVFGLGFLIWLVIKKVKNVIIYFTIIMSLICFNAFTIYKHFPCIDIKKILTFNERAGDFARLDDSRFLNAQEDAGIARMKEIVKDEKRIFSFTAEAAMPYLLKKPSCGRNFIVTFCSPRSKENELISDLIHSSPEYILFKSKSRTNDPDGLANANRLPAACRFIESRYRHYETINDYWEVYCKKFSIHPH